MRLRRMTGLVFAGALAACLDTGGVARADVVPEVDGIYELFQPPADTNGNKCLDIADGNRGTVLQVYHCHGSDSNGAVQLWQFVRLDNGNYLLRNQRNHLCAVSDDEWLEVQQDDCLPAIQWEWRIVQASVDPNLFEFQNLWSGRCMAIQTVPASDHASIKQRDCVATSVMTTELRRMLWALA